MTKKTVLLYTYTYHKAFTAEQSFVAIEEQDLGTLFARGHATPVAFGSEQDAREEAAAHFVNRAIQARADADLWDAMAVKVATALLVRVAPDGDR